MGPGGVGDDEPILCLGYCTGQMALLLSLVIVVSLCHGEDSAELVFEFVDGLRRDRAFVDTCHFFAEVDQGVVRVVRCFGSHRWRCFC